MPFRDSYQTSMYLATLLALNFPTTKIENWAQLWINEWPDKSQKLQLIEQIQQDQKKLDGLLKPQIFEIGRTHAVHLASPPIDYPDTWIKDPADTRFPQKNRENNNDRCDKTYLLGCDAIEQERQKEIDTKVISQLFILISTILILGYLSFKSVAECLVTVIGSVISCAAIGFILLWYYLDNFSNYQTGEPFLWLEGVSVWPNLVIRYFGIIFILLVFHHYYTKLREAKEIKNDLKLPEPQESKGNGHWLEGLLSEPFSGSTSRKKEAKELWFEYMQITDYSKSKGFLWILFATIISLVLTCFGLFSLGYLNFPSRGEITQNLHNILAFVQFSILWGLIYWVGYEATTCKRFIDQLEPEESSPDQLDWPPELVQRHENKSGISEEELKPYFRFLLITKLTKRINSIVYIPFILMLLIAIGRSNLFDNLGFSPALIIVFLSASAYLITILFLLRKSAIKQCEDILYYYEEYRPGMIASAFGVANKINLLATEIRNIKQKTFAPLLQGPPALALLLPGGGIGLTSIVEYLYN